ncbi:bifunctional methylenetetrahydrofolate dehydrogenase/methenyltetrahydrofolate cyclohydrolase FolD [Niveispirillum sp.]|uniref:bifunctional methylenetetrahydrofolate dehydrogenase/methenyltetrahydrofolate cyclohydrolase FolD n=1 Tax=Niveispirillum sp. TaxID=1917217 RepID=UPI001B459B0F|nr:bifunctional methylenetetrahydrofolate dehydrogenase/methenyltetrahydrofolate cyclohydrolase FolD [Niveispirillum sp.]MBP7339572.1 bifunctional methylenetetrahydrofolate dehydrogenase/methenyltetrahydrofolate cyclohydrolase FolD [Niveispirillum sp.]
MAEARIIDGKGFAAGLRARIGAAVEQLRTTHALVPGLAVVLVGEDPASAIYVRNKGEQTREAGMHSVTHRLDASTSQEELLRLVNQLNNDPSIHGILVQLPLPGHIDTQAVLSAIDPAKDVDGFHVVNAGRLSVGLPALVPCTPLGCMLLLKDTVKDLRGLHAVVVGRSNIVGKPMAQLLLQADCTVTVAHSRTRDLAAMCREADILVAAVGRPEMVKGDWIKEGAVVIDVGINRVPARDPAAAAAGKTRIVGDVCYAEAASVAGAITPVPGGVGPMTIACLLANTVTAACRSAGVAVPAGIGL